MPFKLIDDLLKNAGACDKIAQRLCFEKDASISARQRLMARWTANEEVYRCARRNSGIDIIEGMNSDDLPIWAPKSDRIVDAVAGQLTGLFPMVQCIDESGGGANVEDVELGLTTLAERAKYSSRHLKPCIEDAVNTNAAVLRIGLQTNDDGQPVAFEFAGIHPKYVVAFPHEVDAFSECSTVGHRFDKQVWEVKEMVESGEYIDPGCEIVGGDAVKGENDDDWGDDEKLVEPSNAEDPDDENIQLYEFLTKIRLKGDSKRRWYLCTVWPTMQKLLKIQPYGALRSDDKVEWYPEPWYVLYRMKHNRDTLFTDWAVANAGQTLQNRVMELIETGTQGTMFTAFPTDYIIGGNTKFDSTKTKPGTQITLDEDVKVISSVGKFMPGMIEPLLQFLLEVLDAASGISRLGTTQNLPGSESATAAAGFLQAQNEAKGAYADSIAIGVEATWRIMFWLLQMHADTIIAANSLRLPESLTPEKLQGLSLRMEVTGSDASASPNILIQKLQFALTLVGQVPGFDRTKIIEKILQALNLPFTIDSLRLPGPKLSQQVVNLLVSDGYSPEMIQQAFTYVIQQQMAQQAAAQQMEHAQAMHREGVSDNAGNGPTGTVGEALPQPGAQGLPGGAGGITPSQGGEPGQAGQLGTG